MKPKTDSFIAPPCHGEIEILYQDQYLLVINKPSGLLTLSGKNPLNKDSVHFRLTQNFPTASMLHRLDFGTSGILVIALSKDINSLMTKQFQQGLVEKTYCALLLGLMKNNHGEINQSIIKDKENFPLVKVCAADLVLGKQKAKQALTHYQVLERDSDKQVTRVRFEPRTGRTHQLRVHSAFIGHAILGDDLYAPNEGCDSASRLMLHADKIAFRHPVTAEHIEIICQCPF